MELKQEEIKTLKEKISQDQVTKLWLYFRLLNEETREEFIKLVSLMFVLSEKPQKLTKEEIQFEVLQRYFISQDNDDIFYIVDFAAQLQKVDSVAFKDKLMETIKGFCSNK